MSFLFYLSGSLLALSVLLAGVSLSALRYATENVFVPLLIVTILALFISFTLMVIASGAKRGGSRANGFVSIVGIWLALPLLAAIPILLLAPEMSFTDALFEATSGLTTTGASILQSIDPENRPLLFWRACLQWFGGFVTLATIFLLLAPAQVGGLPQKGLHRVAERANASRWNALLSVAPILMVYVLLTLTSVIALLIADMPTFDSVALAMSSISTGGFTVRNGSLETYNNAAAEYVLMVTMFLGASSFIWLRYLLDRNWQQAALHRETYVLAGLVVLLGLGIGTSLAASSGSVATLHPLTALREGLFHAVSLMSTTGLESRAAGLLLVPPPLIIILIVVGGASFSTSGGLQIFRVGAMLLQSVRELNRLLYPHSVQRFRLGTENYTIQTMKTIWSLALVFGLTLAVGLVGLSLQLPSFEMALMAATALLTNSGPVYSSAAAIDPNWLPYADFSTPSKVMSMALMILGRVQTLVLLGALSVFIFKDGLWRPASHFSSNRQERT